MGEKIIPVRARGIVFVFYDLFLVRLSQRRAVVEHIVLVLAGGRKFYRLVRARRNQKDKASRNACLDYRFIALPGRHSKFVSAGHSGRSFPDVLDVFPAAGVYGARYGQECV